MNGEEIVKKYYDHYDSGGTVSLSEMIDNAISAAIAEKIIIDCRTCTKYIRGKCYRTVKCIDGNGYSPLSSLQLFKATE